MQCPYIVGPRVAIRGLYEDCCFMSTRQVLQLLQLCHFAHTGMQCFGSLLLSCGAQLQRFIHLRRVCSL